MARKEIGTGWNRDNRNNMNDNFKETFAIKQTADDAKQKSQQAENKSNTALSNSQQAIDDASTALQYTVGKYLSPPADTFNDISTLHPNPESNDRVWVKDTGKAFIFQNGTWEEFAEINETQINEVDDRLSSQLSETKNVIKNQLSILNYSDYVVDNDWSIALSEAEASLPEDGGVIHIPELITIKQPVVFNKRVRLSGINNTHTTAQQATSGIIKDGDFTAVTLFGRNSFVENMTIDGASGNGGDGLRIAASRVGMRNVAVLRQGRHGIVVGGEDKPNCNGWNFANLYTASNGGDGLHLDWVDVTVPPNLSAGILTGIDARDNSGNGVYVGSTLNNTFLGIMSQHNGLHGVYVGDNAVGNHFINPYVEKNTIETDKEFFLDVGSKQNYISGQRSRIVYNLITDNGEGNFVLGYNADIPGNPIFNYNGYFTDNIGIKNRGISGLWSLENKNDRDLNILLGGTSANGKVDLVNEGKTVSLRTSKLEFETSTKGITGMVVDLRSIDLTWFEPLEVKEFTIEHSRITRNSTVICTPRTAMPDGLTWNTYVATDGVVTLKVSNISDSNVVANVISFKTTAFNTDI